jgi:hypothetical protein
MVRSSVAVAAVKLDVAAWLTVMVVVPAPVIVTLLPVMVATPGLLLW